MSHRIIIGTLVVWLTATDAVGQVFSHDKWEQKNLFSVKVSQLYYEANVGINMRPQNISADFLYFAFGYGSPTKKNAWRKFLPERDMPEILTKEQKEIFSQSGMDDLHAGKVGIGWNHWFNHFIGFYAQAGWGFIVDLSTGDDLPEEIVNKLGNGMDKETFIYNTVPVELGLTLNVWNHYNVQAGVTYMWKEIPLLTVGVGYSF